MTVRQWTYFITSSVAFSEMLTEELMCMSRQAQTELYRLGIE